MKFVKNSQLFAKPQLANKLLLKLFLLIIDVTFKFHVVQEFLHFRKILKREIERKRFIYILKKNIIYVAFLCRTQLKKI